VKCGYCKTEDVNRNHVVSCAKAKGDKVPDRDGSVQLGFESPAHVRPAIKRRDADRSAMLKIKRELSLQIPEGYYAVPREDGKLAFYEVDKPTEGKWAGYTFIKVQASEDFHRLPGIAAEIGVMRKIARDPQEAMLTYGKKIGRCGHCHKTLTKDSSRARGMGDTCAKNMGWRDAVA